MKEGNYSGYAAIAFCAVLAIYLLVAYVIVPALWADFERQPGLKSRPMVTVNAQGIPGDPLNVGLVGTRTEIVRAMTRAGWYPADPITMRSSLEIGLSVVLDRAYLDAPVSSLFYEGRKQDLAFEKPLGRSAARRHHVRLWLALAQGSEGREVWLGSASFDRSVGFSHDTGQITHHIDADLDAERTFLIQSLATPGALDVIYRMAGSGATLNGRNAEGDPYFTDGEIMVGVLAPAADAAPAAKPATLPAPNGKDRIWAGIVAVARLLHLVPVTAEQPRT